MTGTTREGCTMATDLHRREMLLGIVGASAILLSESGRAYAQQDMGVERKILKTIDSMIPGFKKVQIRDVVYQAGSRSKNTMKNAMVCECATGSLEIIQDNDKPMMMKKGDFWTCNVGTVEETINKGKSVAVMRVVDLLPG